MRTAATSLLKDGQATLANFQALIEKDDYKAEMSILSKRQEWLAATLEEDPEQLRSLIVAQKAAAGKKDRCNNSPGGPGSAADAQTVTAAEDFAAMSRAPPCASWASMVNFTQLKGMGSFSECRSQKDIRDKNDQLKKIRANMQSLLSATKAAGNDLVNAKKRADASRQKQKEKAEKNARKKQAEADPDIKPKRKRAFGNGPKTPPLLNLELGCLVDMPALEASGKEAWSTQALMKPWLIHGPDILDKGDADVRDFASVFRNSNLRVTEGFATRKLSDRLAIRFCKDASHALHDVFQVGPPGPDSDPAAQWDSAFTKGGLAPAFWAMVTQHCSMTKFQTALAPTVKYICEGTALVSVWVPRQLLYPRAGTPETVLMTADFQANAMKATEEDVKKVQDACPEIYIGTVGPRDMLYIPPGSLFSVQALRHNVCSVMICMMHDVACGLGLTDVSEVWAGPRVRESESPAPAHVIAKIDIKLRSYPK